MALHSSFKIWLLIGGLEVIKKQNFSSLSLKLCLLVKKQRDMGF